MRVNKILNHLKECSSIKEYRDLNKDEIIDLMHYYGHNIFQANSKYVDVCSSCTNIVSFEMNGFPKETRVICPLCDKTVVWFDWLLVGNYFWVIYPKLPRIDNTIEADNGKIEGKKSFSESARWEVFARDDFTCQHCGTRTFLTIDHIVPKSKSGGNQIENLQTLCRSCNSRKGKKTQ